MPSRGRSAFWSATRATERAARTRFGRLRRVGRRARRANSGGADEEGVPTMRVVPTIRTPLRRFARRDARRIARRRFPAAGRATRNRETRPRTLRTALETHAHALQSPSRHLRRRRSNSCARSRSDGECPPLDECSSAGARSPGEIFRWLEITAATRRTRRSAGDGIREKVPGGDGVDDTHGGTGRPRRGVVGGADGAMRARRFPRALATLWPEMIKTSARSPPSKNATRRGTRSSASSPTRNASVSTRTTPPPPPSPRARTVRVERRRGESPREARGYLARRGAREASLRRGVSKRVRHGTVDARRSVDSRGDRVEERGVATPRASRAFIFGV